MKDLNFRFSEIFPKSWKSIQKLKLPNHMFHIVTGSPYIRLIPKVTAVAGETLRLKCPVAGYPIEEIYWEKGKIVHRNIQFAKCII